MSQDGVLIVPLWNWNLGSLSSRLPSKVLIVPLWNWNLFRGLLKRYAVYVLIVPLWNWNLAVIELWANERCSNRTFMELKYEIVESVQIKLYVLIVPLWNWNLDAASVRSRHECSNRTFMELKSKNSLSWLMNIYSSNRTFMELK